VAAVTKNSAIQSRKKKKRTKIKHCSQEDDFVKAKIG